MESSFVSVFKLDGVPILPPLVNDEVRAAVAVYRAKAIEIEKRLQERKRTLAAVKTVDSQSIEEDSLVGRQEPDVKDDGSQGALSDDKKELETTTYASSVAIDTTSVEEDSSNQSEPSTITVPSRGLIQHEKIVINSTETEERVDQAENVYNTTANETNLDDVIHPSWQSSSTRTVTPTNSEESTTWFPLVRSNTFDLEKPTIDLMNLQRVDHSTPVDRAKVKSPDELKQPQKPSKLQTVPVESKSKKLNPTVVKGNDNTPIKASQAAIVKSKTEWVKKSPPKQTNPSIMDPAKSRPKRKTASRKLSHCAIGSGVESDRALESVAQALTTHEQRMMELWKRQEEERLLLEESFRQKTQELVALCAKTRTVEENGNESSNLLTSARAVSRTITPDMQTASSVSQLSLCDVSYDSCTDTDDAAYQTCHANGTSDENVNNKGEHTLTEDQLQPLVRKSESQDNNGNDCISQLLPQRMTEFQQSRAATIINAYVRGYLTRRLFQTDEVQNIKRTIADIVCFIISTQQTQGVKEDAKQAALRRNAGKQIAYCLDQLHTIFVTCTPRERLQMIRRDRYMKSKATLPKRVLS